MTALRLGMLCFGVGLFAASVAGVAFGVTLGCTDVGCDGSTTLALRGVSLAGVAVFDGCNTCQLNPAVVGGTVLSAVGVLVGGGGVAGELFGDE